jgi:hypothetical protein
LPRVSIYPAYSSPPGWALPILLDLPEKATALTIKRAAGHDTTSWLYVRLPRHKYDEKCDCYSCEHVKAGWWDRPAWVRKSEFRATWHRWQRYTLGARNVRLTIKGGEAFTVIAPIDMPAFAFEMAQRGRHGQLMVMYWYASTFGLKAAPVVATEDEPEPASLDELRAAKVKAVLYG